MHNLNYFARTNTLFPFDRWLFLIILALMLLGLIMVASSSIMISSHQYHYGFHFLLRQIIFLSLGLVLASIVVQIPLHFWQGIAWSFYPISMALLILVLIPGLGHQINGSMRWLGIGSLGIQVSELVKLLIIVFLADYLVRTQKIIQLQFQAFLKPMLLLGLLVLLLLKEPDFGASVVILLTALSMMFLAGVPLRQFLFLLLAVGIALSAVAISSPYRLQRLTVFLNPWSTQFDSGYQLTQALIAFGRGGWLGVGLGSGLQKLFYLPEAHTDFLYAVLGEELGLLGALSVIILFSLFVGRILYLGRSAQRKKLLFPAFLAYGIAFWIAFQALINMGVNVGLLPTKGLTLPFLSYGGSSQLVMGLVMALLFRIAHEQGDRK